MAELEMCKHRTFVVCPACKKKGITKNYWRETYE